MRGREQRGLRAVASASASTGLGSLPLREIIRRAFRETLDDEHLDGEIGALYLRTANLDFALRAGIRYTPDDILYDEFLALRVLHAERDSYQEDLMKSAQLEAQKPPPKWSNV